MDSSGQMYGRAAYEGQVVAGREQNDARHQHQPYRGDWRHVDYEQQEPAEATRFLDDDDDNNERRFMRTLRISNDNGDDDRRRDYAATYAPLMRTSDDGYAHAHQEERPHDLSATQWVHPEDTRTFARVAGADMPRSSVPSTKTDTRHLSQDVVRAGSPRQHQHRRPPLSGSSNSNSSFTSTFSFGEGGYGDEEPVFLVPVDRSPSKTPHRQTKRRITPHNSLSQGGVISDSAEERQSPRRRPLSASDHLIGGAVHDDVPNEVEERTRRSRNDRYQFRPPNSFTASCPLPNPGRSAHDAPPTPNRRHDNHPPSWLRHSGAVSRAYEHVRPPSAHRPRDNLETSAVIARAPPHRPSRRMFHEKDHLEASGFRPREDAFEQTSRPLSQRSHRPQDTWSLAPRNPTPAAPTPGNGGGDARADVFDSGASSSRCSTLSSPSRSRVLSFHGHHIYADEPLLEVDHPAKDGRAPLGSASTTPSSATPASTSSPSPTPTASTWSSYGSRRPHSSTSTRPADALRFSGAVVSPTARTTPVDTRAEAFHRAALAHHTTHQHQHQHQQGRRVEEGDGSGDEDKFDQEGHVRRSAARKSGPRVRVESQQRVQPQRKVAWTPPPSMHARSQHRPRDNLAFSGGVTRRSARLLDLIPQ
ncbi:hypothetical protein PTSG_06213 [Salpingoeca rosetta]|uniref:Uncharacterized protein n=1 Tax=Salpingoeca rosetta (strain ATCC 50818 / BSB-021) TaxID=946362 RepID=F2UC94_SALR5|nr:uncharacterized protein PTSG_06213 [Salpingoeca rosetta]EGD74201.1 hypothetical protein PTSG_06213 [Salpingoeca rosetta]|eukprot:XP_004993101.1 hypothetical protein PTSG_06213 [Salpingoeca rosetta]